MKNQITETTKPDSVKSLLNRLNTSIIRACVLNVISQIALGTPSPAQAQGNFHPAQMDRQKEIALALSACPDSVASKAAIYVLEKDGYTKIRDSENGFTAIVQHSLPTSQEPQCMDAEGTRTVLPRYLRVAEWRAQGKTPDEINRLLAEGFAKGTFQPPSKPGIDYMLSNENLVQNAKGEVTHFPPHVMFYAPYLSNADLGVGHVLDADGNLPGPAFVAGEGTPMPSSSFLYLSVGTQA